MLARLHAIRTALGAAKLDGWLVFDFHRTNPVFQHLLGDRFSTRRSYLWLPHKGRPRLLIHHVDRALFDGAPAALVTYTDRQSMEGGLKDLLRGARTVAMEYSPGCAIPTLSRVDAGTVELVRALGVRVVSSATIFQEAVTSLGKAELALHHESVEILYQAKDAAFASIRRSLAFGGTSEFEVQQRITDVLHGSGAVWDGRPIVAVNAHSGDPHYMPTEQTSRPIRKGDWVLLDLWCKTGVADGIYGDITWVGYCGAKPPAEHQAVFAAVTAARDAGVRALAKAAKARRTLAGWEVDAVVRGEISRRGYGRLFTHRTGHSIGTEGHWLGVNIDGFETRDERPVAPGALFSIEPGVYRSDFGVRSEIDVYMGTRGPVVTTPPQRTVVTLA